MVSTVDAAAVCELHQPHLKCSAARVEKCHLLEEIGENNLHNVFSLAGIMDNFGSQPPDQALITAHDHGQRVMTARLRVRHQFFVWQRLHLTKCKAVRLSEHQFPMRKENTAVDIQI